MSQIEINENTTEISTTETLKNVEIVIPVNSLDVNEKTTSLTVTRTENQIVLGATESAGAGGGAVDSVNGQTGVVVLDADDIDDASTDHKFVTSGDLTKLSNLSGTNTGDQDLTPYYTSGETDTAIATALGGLVDSSPETLDTLNELAAALGDDPNFATTVTSQIAGKANISHTHEIADITGLQAELDSAGADPAGNAGDVQLNIGGAFASLDGFNLDTTGNARGTDALDLQTSRSAVDRVASGQSSVALGKSNKVGTISGVVIGENNIIDNTRFGGISIGRNNNATGVFNAFGASAPGFAFGDGNSSVGLGAFSMGTSNTSSGMQSYALGFSSQATGSSSFAIGRECVASGANSTAIGQNVASIYANSFAAGTVGAQMFMTQDGFSVNNYAPQAAFHATGDLLATDINVLGSEKVSDNEFTTVEASSPWTFGDGWSVNIRSIFGMVQPLFSSARKTTGQAGSLTQALTGLKVGAYYNITFKINSNEDYPTGTLVVKLTGSQTQTMILPSFDSGTVVLPATATSGNIEFIASSILDANIFNVSVKEIEGGDIIAVGDVRAQSVIIPSPNGTLYKIKVANDGTLSTEAV